MYFYLISLPMQTLKTACRHCSTTCNRRKYMAKRYITSPTAETNQAGPSSFSQLPKSIIFNHPYLPSDPSFKRPIRTIRYRRHLESLSSVERAKTAAEEKEEQRRKADPWCSFSSLPPLSCTDESDRMASSTQRQCIITRQKMPHRMSRHVMIQVLIKI